MLACQPCQQFTPEPSPRPCPEPSPCPASLAQAAKGLKDSNQTDALLALFRLTDLMEKLPVLHEQVRAGVAAGAGQVGPGSEAVCAA